MNKNILHKIISIFTVILLLLPIGVQLFHTLENHEHKVCNSKEVQHIHEKELDCSFCHLQLKESSILEFYSFDEIILIQIDSTPFLVAKRKTETYQNFTFSMGSPTFIV